MNEREPAVAGAFYPRQKEILEKQLNGFFKGLKPGEKSSAVIAPHAGYEYSGKTAAIAFSALQKAETIAVLGPNHTGIGTHISVSNSDFWQTPLGKIQVNAGAREKLLQILGIEAEETAHFQEHSIEVELPFLQFLFKEFKILPICIMGTRLEELQGLGNALAGLENISVVASSDFSHFLPEENARKKDLEAIEFIKKIDINGFYNIVREKQLSICGFSPIIAAMQFAKKKGLRSAELLEYETSASATGDSANVVGYAAIKFVK